MAAIKYDHILVGLDLTDLDQSLIQYAVFFLKLFNIKKLTFLHVVQAYDLPKEQKKDYGALDTSLREHIHKKLEQYIRNDDIQNLDINLEIKIEEQDASDVIIDYTRENNADLVILGKKAEEERKEVYAKRVIALAESDMLLVPARAIEEIHRILVAIDFSKPSVKAFRLATNMANDRNIEVHCQYVYTYPKNYFPITPKQNMLRFVASRGVRRAKKFFKEHKQGRPEVTFHPEPGEYNYQGEKVFEKANEVDAQLVIVGGRGRTSDPTTLLGNIADQLRKYESGIPVLVVKNYTEKNSFWNIFFHG